MPQTEYVAYLPSNGTEGEIFMSRWCYVCASFDPDWNAEPCPIMAATLSGQEVAEWREDGPKGPRCTAFRDNPEEPGPLDPNAVVRPLL